jgi:lipid-A-disaccharide synthase
MRELEPIGRPPKVMLVAAEASGDVLGAGLMRALRTTLGGRVQFVGVGGSAMTSEGLASPFSIADLSILGLVEGLAAYPRVIRRADETAALAARERPDVAVLIDSWGFTLRVAQRLRRLDPSLPLVKYVGPQVWASRPGRARTLAGAVDRLLAIHAFDAPYFEAQGLKTTFVGNSTLARDLSHADPERLRAGIGAAPNDPILLLLPGSRQGEVSRLMPIYARVVERLGRDRPHLKFVLPVAVTVKAEVKAALATWSTPVHLIEGDQGKDDAMRAASVALACSGTVTTELALAGCPMVVAYRVGRLTHLILKRLITTRFATLINIAADEEIAPEFLQYDCTPNNLASALAERLDNAALRQRQVERQDAALDRMGRGGPDPSSLAAEAVIETLSSRARG